MLAPIPVFIFSATQKVWSSVREEIRALHFDSEEESSSCSDDETETQYREVMAMIHTKKKNIPLLSAEANHGSNQNDETNNNMHRSRGGAAADVPLVAVESHHQHHRPPLPQKKHALRNVSVAEYLRAEDESREAREEQEQRSRELRAANAALHQQQRGSAGQTFVDWRRSRQQQQQGGSASNHLPHKIQQPHQQLAQPLLFTSTASVASPPPPPVFLEINDRLESSSPSTTTSSSLSSSLDDMEIDIRSQHDDGSPSLLLPVTSMITSAEAAHLLTRELQYEEQLQQQNSDIFGRRLDIVADTNQREDAKRAAAFRSVFALAHQREHILGASSSVTDDMFDIL